MPRHKKLADLALSTGEAADVLGVHWTRVARMAAKGQLRRKVLTSAWSPGTSRAPAVYSLSDCEENYAEYLAMRQAGDPWLRRPRTRLDERADMLERLRHVPQITFDDAVGTGEAAEALRVEPSVVVVYAERGWIVGRKPVDRGRAASDSRSRWWILSQQSIDERRQRVIDAELTGSKPGVRKFFEDVG
jgi:hypothetical protein